MKKFVIINICLLFMVSFLVGCNNSANKENSKEVFTGKVIEHNNESILLCGMDNISGELYYISMNEKIPDNIDKGYILNIGYDGLVQETYPATIPNVDYVEIEKEDDDVVGLYRNVFNDLYKRDSALNENIDLIAIDLTGVSNLSDSEKSALSYVIWNDTNVETKLSTYDELLKENLITYDDENSKATQFENGVLFKFETSKVKDNSFKFNAEKWRSSLGAYYFVDCIANRNHHSYTYKIGSEAIS